jgi:hypothetical protein
MVIKQQYYTSTRFGVDSARTGYQVKAQSAAIPQSVLESLGKFIGYRIPTSLDPKLVDQHPVSLRYYCFDAQTALLICSQSNGPDEMGRPGNFFAHSLITGEDYFANPPLPIFYWQAGFWVSQDETEATELADLPQLDVTQATLEFAAIWDFLAQEGRQTWLEALLAAVVDYENSRRRIIIVDSADNVALWVTACCAALPHRYARYLSFATYYHDPIRSPFLITGTTADATNFTPDDFNNYFIIDASTQRISQSPPSGYVEYVLSQFQRDEYEKVLPAFFEDLAARTPGATQLPAQLDHYTNFWRAQQDPTFTQEDPKAMQAARTALADIVAHERPGTQNDLITIIRILEHHLTAENTAVVVEDYLQTLKVLHPQDTNPQERLPRAAYFLMALILEKQPQQAAAVLELLNQLYGETSVRETINQAEFLNVLVERLQSDDLEQQTILWSLLGDQFDFSAEPPTAFPLVLQKTFQAIDQHTDHDQNQPSSDVAQLLQHLNQPLTQYPDLVLDQAAEHARLTNDSRVLKWLYYDHVRPVAVPNRNQQWGYWAKYVDVAPDLYLFELEQDFKRLNNTEEAFRLAVMWGDSVDPEDKSFIFGDAVKAARALPFVDVAQLSRLLLAEEQTERLLPVDAYKDLLATALQGAELIEPNPEVLRLYERILSGPAPVELSPENEAILKGALALSRKELKDADVPALQQRFNRVGEKNYIAELRELLKTFFVAKGHPRSHYLMLYIVYNPRHRTLFWPLYWEYLEHLIVENKKVKAAAAILDLWFRYTENFSKKDRYMIQDFSLQLPAFLTALGEHKGYKKIAKELHDEIHGYEWRSIIEPHLPEGRKRRFGF